MKEGLDCLSDSILLVRKNILPSLDQGEYMDAFTQSGNVIFLLEKSRDILNHSGKDFYTLCTRICRLEVQMELLKGYILNDEEDNKEDGIKHCIKEISDTVPFIEHILNSLLKSGS
jgi:hypothetical protein